MKLLTSPFFSNVADFITQRALKGKLGTQTIKGPWALKVLEHLRHSNGTCALRHTQTLGH